MIPDLLKKLNRVQVGFGGCFLVLMICITCANILLRQFGMPVRGTFELMGFMGALIFALSLGYSHEKKEHLYVSILFDRFPAKVQNFARKISLILSTLFFSLLSFQLVKKALNLKDVDEVSETLRIAYYPLIFVLAFGVMFLVVLFICELLTKSGDVS